MAAGTAWALAHVAKAITDRPRPYEAIAGAVLRQQPAHGTSFASSHTAVTLAVANDTRSGAAVEPDSLSGGNLVGR